MTVPRCVVTAFGFAAFALSVPACGGEDEAPKPSDEEKIAKTGNAWAPLFAAGADSAACRYEGQPTCEQIRCKRFNQPIEGCTPPPLAYRKSFADATVEDVAISGENAVAEFSNGATVAFNGGQHEPGTPEWYVSKLRGDVGKKFFNRETITNVGNSWAALFAKDDLDYERGRDGCRYMVQPACERMYCERITGPIKNCTPPSAAFRRSFVNATVERVVVEGHNAAAEFSNGELVEFYGGGPGLSGIPEDNGEWFVRRYGGDAGEKYFTP